MGYIKIFEMDENGAGWKDLDQINDDEKNDLELALLDSNAIQVACVICFKVIPSGTGNTCETHKGQQPSW